MKKRVVTIHFHNEATEQTIQASVAGLGRSSRDAAIERIHSEGMNLLSVRAWHRKFRAPVEVHFLTEADTREKVVGLLQAEDARCRKEAVRVEISR